MSGTVKTAISVRSELFDAVNQLAEELHVSRSKLFTLAVEEFLEKADNRKLLARINKAYVDDQVDAEEAMVQAGMRRKQAANLEADTW